MKEIKNISTSDRWKDWYQGYGEEIAKLYPDYQITVDGGPYRWSYELKYEIDTENKTLMLDFYLPLYINWKECKKWLINELEEKYGIKAIKK